jgi:cilia- and flagella-associated protein 52
MGKGVNVVEIGTDGQVFVGAGDGTVAIMTPDLKIKSKYVFDGEVTSISYAGEKVNVGTSKSNIYELTPAGEKLEGKLVSACHSGTVTDINFPQSSSEIFVTSGGSDIRIWNAKTLSQLVLITLPNITCTCVVFKKDGSSIISGWSDGKIRAFGPQSGREQYVINDAHTPSVTALAVTEAYNSQGDFHIISGGEGK